MSTTITGKNIELTEAIKTYINQKTEKLFKHFDKIISIDVEVDKNKHHLKGEVHHVRMNVTIPTDLIHAEETNEDLYAAIDLCRDEVDRQLRKKKEKYESRKRKEQKTRRGFKSIFSFWK